MELSKKKLSIYEVMRYLNNAYGMGEIVKNPGSVRKAIYDLKKSQKNDGLDNILTNWEGGLKSLGFDEKIGETLKGFLKGVLINLDKVEKILGILSQEYKKDILGMISSCVGIYHIDQDQWKEKSKLEVFRRILPFTDEGDLKDLEWFIKKKNIDIKELFENTGETYLNDLGKSLSTEMIIKKINEDGYADDRWMKIWQEVFFRRVQWDIWSELRKKDLFTSKQILKFISVLEKIVHRLEVVKNKGKFTNPALFINQILDVIIEEFGLKETETEKEINDLKPTIAYFMNLDRDGMLKIFQSFPTLEELKNLINEKKLRDNGVHLMLARFQNEYNEVKREYQLEKHKEFHKKIKGYLKDKNFFVSEYVAYFLIDSQAFVDNQIVVLREKGKGISKLEKFKESLGKLRPYKVNEDLWNGREIGYTNFLARLCFIVADEKNKVYIPNVSPMMKIYDELMDEEGKNIINDKFESFAKNFVLPQLEVEGDK